MQAQKDPTHNPAHPNPKKPKIFFTICRIFGPLLLPIAPYWSIASYWSIAAIGIMILAQNIRFFGIFGFLSWEILGIVANFWYKFYCKILGFYVFWGEKLGVFLGSVGFGSGFGCA